MTIAARLTKALERKHWTKKQFRDTIALWLKGGQSGFTYQTVLAYFSGSSEPSLEWIRHAARILGVTPEWIAFGKEVTISDRELGKERTFSSQEKQELLDFIFDMRARVTKLEEFVTELIAEREKENAASASREE